MRLPAAREQTATAAKRSEASTREGKTWIDNRQCPLLALSGHDVLHCTCLLLTQSAHAELIFGSAVIQRSAAAEICVGL